jgi:hypothetical protein
VWPETGEKQEAARRPLKRQPGPWPLDPAPAGHEWDVRRLMRPLPELLECYVMWRPVCECGWYGYRAESRTMAWRQVGAHHRQEGGDG